jgi:hypothetical protein
MHMPKRLQLALACSATVASISNIEYNATVTIISNTEAALLPLDMHAASYKNHTVG